MDSTYQHLSLINAYDVPLPGELLDSEIAINASSGRFWAGTEFGIVELGNAHEKQIGPATAYNVTSYQVSAAEDFPIIIPDPLEVPVNVYKSNLIAITYLSDSLVIPNSVFNHNVNWGEWGYFDEADSYNYKKNTDNQTHPLKHYYADNRTIVFEIFSFGPSNSWSGKINWVSN